MSQSIMRICFLSNHIFPFHVGGSEMVIKNISERLVSLGHQVYVYGWDVRNDMVENGVSIKTLNIDKFGSVLRNNDVIIVYSDSFLQLSQLLRANEAHNKKIVIFPVGFSGANGSSSLCKAIFNKENNIHFVCHDSIYIDAKMLDQKDIKYDVIPNGVSESEFLFDYNRPVPGSVLKILCVANAFPKKGHPELFKICDMISRKQDIELNIFCHTPAWDVGKRLQAQLVKHSETRPYKCKMHIDKPRKEVVDSFLKNDLFLFCSLKEVAPLCILESCAAGMPWVSFNVGNVKNINGGLVNHIDATDQNGYIIPSQDIFEEQVELVKKAVDKDMYSKLSKDGVSFAKERTWEKIALQYVSTIKN